MLNLIIWILVWMIAFVIFVGIGLYFGGWPGGIVTIVIALYKTYEGFCCQKKV